MQDTILKDLFSCFRKQNYNLKIFHNIRMQLDMNQNHQVGRTITHHKKQEINDESNI